MGRFLIHSVVECYFPFNFVAVHYFGISFMTFYVIWSNSSTHHIQCCS